MNDLIGKQTIETCPYCSSMLWANNVGTTWCKCGYSNDEELSEVIYHFNLFVELKRKQKRIETFRFYVSILFAVVWVGMLLLWLLIN